MRLDEIFRLDERHQDIVSALTKYKDRDDIFISYRDIPKLGVYPMSTYDTPLGIYCYPIKQMWQYIVDNNVPFAGDHPYVVVIQEVNPVPDVNANAPNGYNAEMLSRDLRLIKTKFLPDFIKWHSKYNADHSWGNMKRYIERILSLLVADPDGAKFMKKSYWAEKILQETDPHSGSKIGDWNWQETLEEAHFSQETIDRILVLATEFNDGMVVDEETASAKLDEYLTDWLMQAKDDTPCAHFWNVTRMFAHVTGKGRKPSVAWTAMMRSLGYNGFTDRTGSGLIHRNEPTQAVFFSIKSIKLLEILPNVRKHLFTARSQGKK